MRVRLAKDYLVAPVFDLRVH